MGYQRPCDDPVSDSWQGHKNRNPPSSEPGTDYACPYGTPLLAAEAGGVVDAKTSNGGGTGRYITVDLDDGRRVRYLHLSSLVRAVGNRVSRGEVLAYSGASANGSDWGVGAHVHTTLFPGHAYDFDHTMDFDALAGDEEEDEMNASQADQLLNIYNAIFHGGPSMPDGSRSIGQSLADIAEGARPVVSRPDEAGTVHVHGWIQELADVNTHTMALLEEDTKGHHRAGLRTPAWVAAGALILLALVSVVQAIVPG